MSIQERVEALRKVMAERGIDIYIVPTADYHQSEYVGEHFKARKFITGFTGSAGTAVITLTEAGLWTDARYFIQAARQLEGTSIMLRKMGEPDVPKIDEYLEEVLPEGGTIGFDGRTIPVSEGQKYEELAKEKNGRLLYTEDLIDTIWEMRPEISKKPVFSLGLEYTGKSVSDKLADIRKEMKKYSADVHVLTTLDDICWMLNIRGDDVDYFPLVLSYALITMDGVKLYIDENKMDGALRAALAADGVSLCPYNDIYEDIKSLKADAAVMIDPMKMNYALYKNIPCRIIEAANPTILMKAMKNPVELENIRQAHIKDGVAVTKFMHWVKTRYDKERITELSSAEKLTAFRAGQEGYIRDSFEPLCAYADHAAMMHYSPSEETDVELRSGAFFLNDTGGGYFEGSTDITRTFVLGSVDQQMKKYFTAVVRAMMRLSRARFLYGCYGYNLDVLARGPIWDLDLDYQCGTGHGVGYLGNVHEAPTGFRWYVVPSKNEHHQLEEGMVITDEPGIYEDGKFGIRIENEFIVKKGVQNKYGQFMHFETVTFAPIDLDGIDPEEMSRDEKEWLNQYHKDVYKKIGPHLTEEEREWLKEYTREI